MDSAAGDKNSKSHTKLPSWMIEEEPNIEEAKTTLPSGDEVLLGAPNSSYAAESDDFCTPSSPLDLLNEVEIPPCFASTTESKNEPKAEVKAEPESSTQNSPASEPKAEVVKEAAQEQLAEDDPKLVKVKADMAELEKVVNSLEFLSYLKPRLNRIRKNGCDVGDLVGLYRMASQVMLENLQRQTEIMQRNKAQYDRQMRQLQEEVLFEQSSALVTGKAPKKNSYASQRLAAAAEAAGICVNSSTGQNASSAPEQSSNAENKAEENAPDSNAMAALRKQMEYKDSLLLKARLEAEDAEKRCEKMAQDVANVRARLEKDLKIKSQKAKESLFNSLLPVMDSFDGALKSASGTQDAAGLLTGFKQIYSQLLDCCQAEGLEAINTDKQPFDPNFHEAMGHVKTNDVPEDYIYDELRRGYMLDGKLLRASMVRLASPDPDAPMPTKKEDSEQTENPNEAESK